MTDNDRAEWLEADGLGGFTSGTVSGIRTRRYHALLLTAATPPTGRLVLVNGFDAWVDTPAGTFALSSQRYAPDIVHPDGVSRIVAFRHEPWPTWEFEVPGGIRLVQEIAVEHGTGTVAVTWTLTHGDAPVVLRVRPFLSGRDYHSMHHENGAFRFDPEHTGARVVFRPYDGIPAVSFLTDGDYGHAPDWYRTFLYSAERERGLDATEDLASPGTFSWPLAGRGQRAALLVSAGEPVWPADTMPEGAAQEVDRMLDAERRRRRAFETPLDRSADAYLVRRGRGRTLVAGYPWFTDWGRDTFVAARGLLLASGRATEARDVLVEWAGAVSEGMLPNRFADHGESPEFNSVDASLWYVVVVGELLHTASVSATDRAALERAVDQIVAGYAHGTRHAIHADDDGLLAAGVPGQQLTWMDARIGDHVVTPRIGKPVEIQALWINALHVAARIDRTWQAVAAKGLETFRRRFWLDDGYLADVIDVDHVRGTVDRTFRPNQILAVGGLPLPLLTGDAAARVVDAVERRLLTPLGLRSLAPETPGYAPHYEGGPVERDSVYHQGTVWPWLLGPFVEAWLRVHGNSASTRREAQRRFVDPLLAHLEDAGLGHVSEITDADAPFTPRGCPFQAWSLGELLRIQRAILVPKRAPAGVKHGSRRPASVAS